MRKTGPETLFKHWLKPMSGTPEISFVKGLKKPSAPNFPRNPIPNPISTNICVLFLLTLSRQIRSNIVLVHYGDLSTVGQRLHPGTLITIPRVTTAAKARRHRRHRIASALLVFVEKQKTKTQNSTKTRANHNYLKGGSQ